MAITNFKKIEVPFHIPSDVIEEILFFIQTDDIKTLYSCLLLNRQWCQSVVPILWKQPFYYAKKGNSKLISTILSFLNDNQRETLIYNGIILPKKNKSSFNYTSMLKHLHYDFMLNSIDEWCKNLNFTSGNSVSLIMKSILKLFVNKSVKLNSLYILPNHVHWYHYSLNRYMELIEPEFNGLIKNLKCLHVETLPHYPSANFFQKLSLIVHNLEILHLRTPSLGLMRFPNNMEDIMAKSLCTLIQSQTKLKEFKLVDSIKYTSLFISSLTKHFNSLKSIKLFDTKIDEINTWKILTTKFFNLENFEIINCVGLNYDFISLFYNNIIKLKELKFIKVEKNQPIDVNDELKLWVFNRNNYGFLKSGRLFSDINNNNFILNSNDVCKI